MSLPKISVITTSFNAQNTIEQTILSVLKQSYNNFEYILIDAGSKDNTLPIIEKYKEKIHHISSRPDRGISDGFNRGIEVSSGELIWIINADDQLFPEALEKVAQFYKAQNSPDIIYGNLIEVLNGNKRLVIPRSHTLLKEGMVISHPATIVKKEVYNSVGTYSINYKISMDHHFCLRAFLAKKRFVYMNEVLAVFSAEGVSNKSLKNKVKVFTESFQIQNELGVAKLPSLFYLVKKVTGAYIRNWKLLLKKA